MSYSPSMSRGGVANTAENKHKTYCIFIRSRKANIRVFRGELEDMKKGASIIANFLNKPLYDYCKE